MAELSHRERVIRALNHEEPDRVPRDLGGTSVTTINETAYRKLLGHLGLEPEPDVKVDRRAQTVSPSEALLRRLDVDCRSLSAGKSPSVSLSDISFKDEWDVTWTRPSGGHYINAGGPFQRDGLTVSDIERHPWPDPRNPVRIEGLKDAAIRLHEGDYAVVLSVGNGVVSMCQRMRGFAEWMQDLVLDPAMAEALMEHCTGVSVGIAEFILEEVGDYIDVALFQDDLGFQDRSYMRPELYREKVKPYHRRLVEATKRKTGAKVLMHSDGSVYSLIPDLIDIGVDALNPVQVSAKEMDAGRLKAEFGKDLSFWGGIDTHQVLPWGTPDDVRSDVKARIDDLASNGGYVVASVHNIQAEVPPENIVAMFDAALEYGQRAG